VPFGAAGRALMRRRDALLALLPLPAKASRAEMRMAAAWDGPKGSQVGVLLRDTHAWRGGAAIEVPTRAHGIVVEPAGTLLAVARRPGDWLLRWNGAGAELAWCWNDPGRRFNGHARRHGARLYTTETDVETGQGLVVVRDSRTLAVHAVWSSGGVDPHDLHVAADGTLWVADGGVETHPETGRAKRHLGRMDSSLVKLDANDGRLLGQWRLDDPRLSLRHLALWGDRLGVALQAEHDDAAQRAAAPVLAIFDGRMLRACEAQPLAGYGGDIVATADGYVVSVPRAGGIAKFGVDGGWRAHVALEQACALAARGPRVMVGGSKAVLSLQRDAPDALAAGMRLDNHWAVLD